MSLTNALAMDCEMVGAGPRRKINLAAKVSLVNEYGTCVYDTYILPTKRVTDYRTYVSGITPDLLATGLPIYVVKKEVANRIRGRILVGHSVDKDLKVLGLCHPEWNIRDTSTYPPFQTRRGRPSLKFIAARHLGLSIQNGVHCFKQDARATMGLYKKVEYDWEEWLHPAESEYDQSWDSSEEDDSDVYYSDYDYEYY